MFIQFGQVLPESDFSLILVFMILFMVSAISFSFMIRSVGFMLMLVIHRVCSQKICHYTIAWTAYSTCSSGTYERFEATAVSGDKNFNLYAS